MKTAASTETDEEVDGEVTPVEEEESEEIQDGASEEIPDPEPKVTPEVVQAAQEARAKEKGWIPLEEFEGDPADWASAERFLVRGEFIEDLMKERSSNAELKKQVKAMAVQHKKVEAVQYKKAMADLKAKQREAHIEGDEKAADKLDEEMEELREDRNKPPEQAPGEPSLAFKEWHKTNGWYGKDAAMTAQANAEAEKHPPNTSEEDLLGFVRKAVMKRFPSEFSNPKRNQPASTESGGRKPSTDGKLKVSDLTAQETKAMKGFVDSGVMNEKEYLEEVASTREQE